jgi:hypothetical protein
MDDDDDEELIIPTRHLNPTYGPNDTLKSWNSSHDL